MKGGYKEWIELVVIMVQGEESSWRMAASTHHERAIPLNQALAYGVQAHASPSVAAAPPASFLDFQPAAAAAAYFGELEEALIHGANAGGVVDPGMIRADRKHGSTRKDGKSVDAKTERRLAQNREAARKSRLRKKAYVQNLETSRVRLQQIEQELQRARSQGLFLGGCRAAGDMSSGAAMFDMEYARWLDDDSKRLTDLRGGLQAHLLDTNLGLIVEECMQHYDELFQLKAALARSDVFHLLTGTWATPAERCFLWMGGFRPSDLLKILIQQLDPLTEQQMLGIYSLQQSSEQAEEALAQGLQQLHQSLADTVAAGTLNDGPGVPNYMSLMAIALDKLASLESFYQQVTNLANVQADNLRQQTLHQLRRILTTRQAARCFLSIGEYYRRLRALSNLWSSRPRENFIGTESVSPTGTELQPMHNQPQQNQYSGF
uniref:DOG1 domain-containing protein n=1 Tax=Oryza rufipogon TaxID=4529 RepID=A0A0E0N5B5_ORYRU